MKLTVKSLLLSSLAVAALQGCSSSDDDPALLPAPLPVLENPIETHVVWDDSVSDGVDEFYSNLKPVAAYGKIFASSRSGDVYAFDRDTGKELWQTDVRIEPNGFWQTFWFDDDKVARVSGGLSASYETVYLGTEDGEVIALNEATGEIVWRTPVHGEVLSAPAIDDGLVFLQVASGLVYALDAKTGEEKWKTEADVPALTIRGTSSPTFANGGLLVGGANGKMSVYLSDTGQLAWEESVSKASGNTELERVVDVDATPLVVGRNVYGLSYGGTLTAMDFRSGRLVWKREYAGFVDMTFSGNDLIVVDSKSNIYAIDRRNGVEKWSNSQLINRDLTAPVIQGNRIAVGDFEGYLHWLDIETGELVGQREIDSDGLYSQSIVDEGRLFIQSRSGELVAIDAP